MPQVPSVVPCDTTVKGVVRADRPRTFRSVDRAVRDREQVLRRLEANRARRARAESEVEAARRELVELLRLGRKLGYSVTALAAAAGLSRQTAHRHLGR